MKGLSFGSKRHISDCSQMFYIWNSEDGKDVSIESIQ